MRSLSRRRILALVATSGAASLLGACSGATAPATTVPATTASSVAVSATSAATSAVTSASAAAEVANAALTFMCWGDVTVQKIMATAAQQFEQQHAGARVTYINTAGGNVHYQKLETMMAGGDAPDVFYMDPSLMPGYVAKGVLGALDAYVQADHYDVGDFYPKAIGQYNWQGKLYGIPRGFGNQDIYWNTALFQKAGVQPLAAQWDDAAWTTDAFLTLADKLTVRRGGKVTQYGYSQGLGLRQWEPWVWLFGGEVLDQTNTKCLLAEEPAITGLQFLADLMHKYQVMPTPDYTQQESNAAVFASGRLAMNMDIPAALSTYRALKGITWDVAPLPKKTRAVTSGGGIAWAMYSKPAQPQLSWQLLAWLAGPQVQGMECAASATAPPRRSVAQSSCYNDPSRPPKNMAVFLKAPDYVHTDPEVTNFSAVDTLIEKQLSYLWDGSKMAKDVLPPLATQVDGMLKTPGT